MRLFEYEQIRSLVKSELGVYNCIVQDLPRASEMSIRQLAEAAGVSTTTVLRFCAKVGCSGYQELKYRMKKSLEQSENWHFQEDQAQMLRFFQYAASDPEMITQIDRAAELVQKASALYLLGVGTSGYLCQYGGRYLANLGFGPISVPDPFYPLPSYDLTGAVLIALSVSGDTEQIVTQTEAFRKQGAAVISITNTGDCSLAALSDINLNYHMPLILLPGELSYHNITTQLPVLYYLEAISREAFFIAGQREKSG